MTNQVVKYVCLPDGPNKFIAELGCEVGTFTTSTDKELGWHVPPNMRGPYRPNQLANYSGNDDDYRVDYAGFVLCQGYTSAGEKCKKKAVNRFGRCDQHGGRINPLDKVIIDDPVKDAATQSTSRYKQFMAGEITVDDLDDEELAMCGFRASNGRIFKPRKVPRDLANAFTKAIYERAQAELRSLTVDAARTIGEIMKNKTNEPDIRLKAALATIERNLGKTPTVVSISTDKPFEEVFTDVFTGTREESRKRRAIESERVYAEEVPLGPEYSGTDSPGPAKQDNSGIDGLDYGFGTYGSDAPTADSGNENAHSESEDESLRDARLFERNPAILAQTVEVKPFEYDLTDKRDKITKATKKRYASRALGVDLTGPNIPFIKQETPTDHGTVHVKLIHPDSISTPGENKKATKARKTFTLNDF